MPKHFFNLVWNSDFSSTAHSLHHYHSVELVVLSFIISLCGAYASLQLVGRAINSYNIKNKIMWLMLASLCMGGCAIWAMHFVAMMAYDNGLPIKYDVVITLYSVLIAICVTGAGFLIIGLLRNNWVILMVTGFFMGLGIASMHYTGMYAMVMKADLYYEGYLYILSFIIAIAASTAALWLCFNARGSWQKYGSSILMAVGVCSMHFTGMKAAIIVPNTNIIIPQSKWLIDKTDFSLYITLVVIITLTVMFFLALSDIGEKEDG